MIVQDGEGWEIGAVGKRAARRNAEPLACCGDFGESDPDGLVRGTSEVEGVAVVSVSRKRRYGERGRLWRTASSTGSGQRFGLVALRRCRLQEISKSLLQRLKFVGKRVSFVKYLE